MKAKAKILISELKEKGLFYGLKRIFGYFFRPLDDLFQKSRFLLEIRYGILPGLNPWRNSGLISLPQSDLVKEARKFWYANTPGAFNLDGEQITRKEIFAFGGPNPNLTCSVCQKSEWLSRVRQKNLFSGHICPQAKECRDLCEKQGDESWAHFHQNFNFSLGCDSKIPAPKMLFIDPNGRESFLSRHADIWQLLTQRRFAFCCQVDVVKEPVNINWPEYDLVFMVNNGKNIKFKRPDVPIFLYGHDFWPLNKKGFQWVIDWLKPDVFLSSCLGCWREYYNFPAKTKFAFYPFFDSLFFARPNLGEKQFDLLAVGAVTSSIYKPREQLYKQITKFTEDNKSRYRIEIFSAAGSGNVFRQGSLLKKDAATGKTIRLLNKWSEYLGNSRYVIFGRIEYSFVTGKHYEALGSGAIPIFPAAPDLKYLGIKPFEHYIPVTEVENNNQKLAYFLDNYEKYRYIAEKAVNWYKENSDRLIFNDFEETIREATNYKYPKRIISNF